MTWLLFAIGYLCFLTLPTYLAGMTLPLWIWFCLAFFWPIILLAVILEDSV